jgi:hypothetical protein
MSAPHKLSRKLQETLGPEASDAMIDWMNQTDARHEQLHAELAEFRSEVRADLAELRREMDAKLGALREEMRVGFAKVEISAAQRHADFMKWTLGFWVLSLATLAGTIIGLSNRLR